MSAVVKDGVVCGAGFVRLTLTEDNLQELISRGQGAIFYDDVQVRAGAQYITAWHDEDTIMVAFHIEMSEPITLRRLALAPIHMPFIRPADAIMKPLGAITVVAPITSRPVMFTIYEVQDVGN